MDELLDFATVDPGDMESAAEWFDEHASPAWAGVLDRTPLHGTTAARRLRLR